MKMKNTLIQIVKYTLVFIILICVYLASLICSSIIPTKWIESNSKKSSEEIITYGGEKEIVRIGNKYVIAFLFTDALMLNTAYSIDTSTPLASPMLARKNYIPGQTQRVFMDLNGNLGASENYKADNGDIYQVPEFYGLMHGENIADSFEYARYWHGYKLFLRPLLLVFNYSGIRIINGIIAGLVTLAALWAVARRFGVKYLIAYMAAIICMSPWVIPFSMQNSSIYYIMNIGVIWLCLDSRITMQSFRMPVVLLVMGIMTAFFDFLTYPVASLGVPLTICAIMMKNEKLTDELYVLFKCCVSWAMGYGLMWAGKWAAGSVILHRNVIDNAINQINYRSGNMHENVIMGYMINEKIFFFEKIENPFKTACVDYVLAIMGAIIAVSFILMIIYRNEQLKRKKNLLIFGFIALLPIAWYCVVANHTIVHWFFVFRGLVVFFFAMFAYCMTCFGKRNDAEMMQKEQKI